MEVAYHILFSSREAARGLSRRWQSRLPEGQERASCRLGGRSTWVTHLHSQHGVQLHQSEGAHGKQLSKHGIDPLIPSFHVQIGEKHCRKEQDPNQASVAALGTEGLRRAFGAAHLSDNADATVALSQLSLKDPMSFKSVFLLEADFLPYSLRKALPLNWRHYNNDAGLPCFCPHKVLITEIRVFRFHGCSSL